jgi:hypothetical protein
MNRYASLGPLMSVVLSGVVAISTADGQAPAGLGVAAAARPRQPGGLLSDRLGEYLTIEGVLVEKGKVETNTLLVDSVNGRVLAKPIAIVVAGYAIVDHNLRPAELLIEPKRRYVLKGFENGSMIGVADAVREAAKEKGWREIPVSPVSYSWRPYFVALIVEEPAGIELTAQ